MGSVEMMCLQEASGVPRPRDHEMVLTVKWSSITLADVMRRRGQWENVPEFPFVPGSHVVGEVRALGAQARTPFRAGDRVFVFLPGGGGNAKYAAVDPRAALVARVPRGVGSMRALCLAAVYVPARRALEAGKEAP